MSGMEWMKAFTFSKECCNRDDYGKFVDRTFVKEQYTLADLMGG
jgi:hypothetical protein